MAQLLTPERTLAQAPGVSKKRLFESLANLISDDQPQLGTSSIFSQLMAREKLGSTGLGQGIAIPHCRLPSCEQPMGTLISLEQPVAFDAPDDKPVDLVCALLVPEQAQQHHLDILAALAGLFQQQAFCRALRQAQSNAQLFSAATSWSS